MDQQDPKYTVEDICARYEIDKRTIYLWEKKRIIHSSLYNPIRFNKNDLFGLYCVMQIKKKTISPQLSTKVSITLQKFINKNPKAKIVTVVVFKNSKNILVCEKFVDSENLLCDHQIIVQKQEFERDFSTRINFIKKEKELLKPNIDLSGLEDIW